MVTTRNTKHLQTPPIADPVADPIADPTFTWGSLDAQSFIRMIDKAYAEVVQWKLNL